VSRRHSSAWSRSRPVGRHISFSVPLDMINSELAARLAQPGSQDRLRSVDLWVYTSNYQVAQLEIKGASSTVGNLDMT